MREIVLDTETTGLNYKAGDRVIEVGCVELLNHVPTGNTLQFYCSTEKHIPEDVKNVHGLTNEFLNRRNSLKLPQRIFLECDKFFEEDYLTLTIETSSVEELRKQINYLDKITSEKIKGNKKNSWEKIFTLLKED